jgi:hypothetical protein
LFGAAPPSAVALAAQSETIAAVVEMPVAR